MKVTPRVYAVDLFEKQKQNSLWSSLKNPDGIQHTSSSIPLPQQTTVLKFKKGNQAFLECVLKSLKKFLLVVHI